MSDYFIVTSDSLLSTNSPSLEVYMCTRSTPGSITYEKCEDIPRVQYVKVSPTSSTGGAFILQETFSDSLLTDMDEKQFQDPCYPIQGNIIAISLTCRVSI